MVYNSRSLHTRLKTLQKEYHAPGQAVRGKRSALKGSGTVARLPIMTQMTSRCLRINRASQILGHSYKRHGIAPPESLGRHKDVTTTQESRHETAMSAEAVSVGILQVTLRQLD